MIKENTCCVHLTIVIKMLCERHNVLLIGASEELSTSRVKVYCSRSQDVNIPR